MFVLQKLVHQSEEKSSIWLSETKRREWSEWRSLLKIIIKQRQAAPNPESGQSARKLRIRRRNLGNNRCSSGLWHDVSKIFLPTAPSLLILRTLFICGTTCENDLPELFCQQKLIKEICCPTSSNASKNKNSTRPAWQQS
ncbi:hypothetical protein B9Z55_022656 [Caenorhabditis nigoni]|uniref:Uncharacterized protein n=1 Tax=Caenorhabditis nigoni TaxID=1611254 RepID=A0A2G5SLT1_9PELO|nr:hypothetical protein B9Z55_022656 [Caenorhabditis nigoni]